MGKCVTLQRQITKICAGSLNKLIDIYERNIQSPLNPLFNQPDYDEQFTLLQQAWSMVVPKNGKIIFNQVSIDDTATHNFYIRFIAGITQENWIFYEGNRYDILNVTNVDENNRYLNLEAVIRGSENLNASKA